MKKAHRRAHLVLWLLLTPLMAAILLLAVNLRPREPANQTIPPPAISAPTEEG